jgi:hypothetical protein
MRIALIAAAAVVALTAVGCAPVDNTADPNITTEPSAGGPATGKAEAKPKPKSDLRTITYRIAGTASSADLTYSTASGQEQQTDAHIPWKKTFRVKRGDFAMIDITAQNKDSGTVTCEIDVDGVEVKAAKSSGQYALVSCDHSLGF